MYSVYKVQVYNTVIHSFLKVIFLIVIKYWLYSSCCTILVAYFMLSSLYLLITFPFIALIPLLFLLPTGNH